MSAESPPGAVEIEAAPGSQARRRSRRAPGGVPLVGYLALPALLPAAGLVALLPWLPASRREPGLVIGCALLAVSVALLCWMASTLRRQIWALVAVGERLGTEPVPAGGPRELRRLADALDVAGEDLRRIAGAARQLAGQHDSDVEPASTDPSTGELSAAMLVAAQRAEQTAREQERLQAELAYQAAHDPLTGLPHRAEAERLLSTALAEARLAGHRVGLVFVALEEFRRCNERYGQLAGDHVLLAMAARLRALVPGERDTVCRVGSDEFVVLLAEPWSEAAITVLAERIAEAVGQPVLYEGMLLRVRARVGVAISAPGELDAEGLFGSADRAASRSRQQNTSA